MSQPPDSPRAAYDALAQALLLREPAISAGRMFGVECLLVGRKLFALFQADSMVFKLGGGEHRAALALPGAQVWHPPGQQRAMGRWVQVPAAQAERWPQLAEQALAFIASSL